MATSAYSFAAQPKSVAGTRKKKYRDFDGLEDVMGGTNIMYDARVVRGNTYAARILSQAQQEDDSRLNRERTMRTSKRMRSKKRRGKQERVPSPEPVPGRKHIDVQTDDYLEELTDRPPEKDQNTQTEPLMDRPPSPLFMPAKIGKDVSTQIQLGDLFNFKVEVEPILEVLVGKTLEQAMDEVLEEEELENIRKHKAAFEQQRNIELAEVQRLEAEELRRKSEKNRRKAQETKRVQEEEEVMEKVAARGFAKSYLTDLHTAVFESLVSSGHFFDPVEKEVEAVFMPWLRKSAGVVLGNFTTARSIVEDITQNVVQAQVPHVELYDAYKRRKKAELEALAKQQAEEAAAKAAAEAAKADEDAAS